jgi:hypothetical protein
MGTSYLTNFAQLKHNIHQINEVFIEICPCRSCGIADDRLWRQ